MNTLDTFLDRIRARPSDPMGWLALARWLDDNGRDDEGAAVRAFYPAIRDSVRAGVTLESALAMAASDSSLLGRLVRDIELRNGVR